MNVQYYFTQNKIHEINNFLKNSSKWRMYQKNISIEILANVENLLYLPIQNTRYFKNFRGIQDKCFNDQEPLSIIVFFLYYEYAVIKHITKSKLIMKDIERFEKHHKNDIVFENEKNEIKTLINNLRLKINFFQKNLEANIYNIVDDIQSLKTQDEFENLDDIKEDDYWKLYDKLEETKTSLNKHEFLFEPNPNRLKDRPSGLANFYLKLIPGRKKQDPSSNTFHFTNSLLIILKEINPTYQYFPSLLCEIVAPFISEELDPNDVTKAYSRSKIKDLNELLVHRSSIYRW